jgi:hypothetical protein
MSRISSVYRLEPPSGIKKTFHPVRREGVPGPLQRNIEWSLNELR